MAGGATAVQQAIAAGMAADVGLEITRVIDSPAVTHLRYRVAKS